MKLKLKLKLTHSVEEEHVKECRVPDRGEQRQPHRAEREAREVEGMESFRARRRGRNERVVNAVEEGEEGVAMHRSVNPVCRTRQLGC